MLSPRGAPTSGAYDAHTVALTEAVYGVAVVAEERGQSQMRRVLNHSPYVVFDLVG